MVESVYVLALPMNWVFTHAGAFRSWDLVPALITCLLTECFSTNEGAALNNCQQALVQHGAGRIAKTQVT